MVSLCAARVSSAILSLAPHIYVSCHVSYVIYNARIEGQALRAYLSDCDCHWLRP
jgi:hypothetical protein